MNPTDKLIKEARERAERATPGPWQLNGSGSLILDGPNGIAGTSVFAPEHRADVTDDLPNLEFAAHARQSVPKLTEMLATAVGAFTKQLSDCPVCQDKGAYCSNPQCIAVKQVLAKLDEIAGRE